MNDSGWVKLYRKINYDSKIRRLPPARRWVFVSYLMGAQPFGVMRGYLIDDKGRALSTRQLADMAGVAHTSIIRANQEFIELGLIVENVGGLKIANYGRYQESKTDTEGPGKAVQRVPSGAESSTPRGAESSNSGAESSNSGTLSSTSGAESSKSGAQSGAESSKQARLEGSKNKNLEKENHENGKTPHPMVVKYGKCLALYGRKFDDVEGERLSLWGDEYGDDALASVLTTVLTMDAPPRHLTNFIDGVLRKQKIVSNDPTRTLLALGMKPYTWRGTTYWFPLSEYDAWMNQDFDKCAAVLAGYERQHPDRVIRGGTSG